MFKKVALVTALSTAIMFGGTVSTAEASSKSDQLLDMTYKVYTTINVEKASNEDFQSFLDRILNKNGFNWKDLQASKALMKKQQAEAEKAPVKPAEKVIKKETVEAKKAEATAKKPEPAAEKVEVPAKQPVAKKAETPVQKPVQKEAAPAKQQAAQKAPVAEKTEAPAKQTQQQPQASAQEKQPAQAAQSSLSQFEQQVVELTNQERAKYGLSALQVDVELSKVAREKSRDMAANNYFAHNSPSYGSPFDMMKSFGISYRTAGENIAKGQRTPAEVVNAWMNSEGHRANILNANYTHIGVGYVEQGNHWTQQFIGK